MKVSCSSRPQKDICLSPCSMPLTAVCHGLSLHIVRAGEHIWVNAPLLASADFVVLDRKQGISGSAVPCPTKYFVARFSVGPCTRQGRRHE